jgi:hypothetical protein
VELRKGKVWGHLVPEKVNTKGKTAVISALQE